MILWTNELTLTGWFLCSSQNFDWALSSPVGSFGPPCWKQEEACASPSNLPSVSSRRLKLPFDKKMMSMDRRFTGQMSPNVNPLLASFLFSTRELKTRRGEAAVGDQWSMGVSVSSGSVHFVVTVECEKIFLAVLPSHNKFAVDSIFRKT